MKTTRLGNTELVVSRIGFGCSRIGGFSSSGWRRKRTHSLIRTALDTGITLFDTADAYADGDSELVLGEGLKGQRQRAVICTKGGYVFNERLGSGSLLDPALRAAERLRGSRPRFEQQNFSREYLVSAVEASLRRLKTDYIDLYQLHAPRAAQADSDDLLDTLSRLKESGKIREFGLGLEELDDIQRWLCAPGLGAVQLPYGLLDQEAGASALPSAAAKQIGVLVRSVFGGGWVNEKLSDGELYSGTPKWRRILAFRELAATQGLPLRELALRFSLSAPAASAAIIGMHKPDHLTRALKLSNAAPLSDEVQTYISRVDEFAPLGH